MPDARKVAVWSIRSESFDVVAECVSSIDFDEDASCGCLSLDTQSGEAELTDVKMLDESESMPCAVFFTRARDTSFVSATPFDVAWRSLDCSFDR